MSKVLGIDLASRSTGYALVSEKRVYKTFMGTIKTSPKQTLEESLFFFHEELSELLSKISNKTGYLPDLVVVESTPIRKNFKTNKMLSMFEAIARFVLYLEYQEQYSDCVIVEPVSRVRSVIGLKNSKEETFDFVKKKYKLDSWSFKKDHDIADAIACALYGLKMKKEGEI